MAMVFPQQFGPYTLHQLVGRGGMAEIYRATRPGGLGSFEQVLAIKKILPHLVENDEYITMLIDEARLVVGLNHANIAKVFDLGQIDNSYYIAMEYVHGVDISTIIKDAQRNQRHIPYEHIAYIMSGLCMGLHVAHHATNQQGQPLNIIHRDISPHNVLISFAGDVKVIDFGVAKASSKEGQTQVGVIKGKLLYMAPEQAMAGNIDGRADLFAAGLVMYKMLTWELPFQGDNEFQIYSNILNKEIVPPKVLNPGIPDELNQICMKLLQRDVQQRYQDGYSAKKDFDRALHRIAPGYNPSRLGRFIEDNFLEMVQERLRRQNEQVAKPAVAPERIKQPVAAQQAAHTGAAHHGQPVAAQHQPQPSPPQQGMGFGPAANFGQTPAHNLNQQQNTPSGFNTPQTPANAFYQSPQQQPQNNARTQNSNQLSTGKFDAPTFPPAQAPQKKGAPLVLIAVVIMAVLFVAMGAYVFLMPSEPQQPEQPPATTQDTSGTDAVQKTEVKEPDTNDPGIAVVDAGAPAADVDMAEPAAEAPTTYQLQSEPAGANCFLNGERQGKTPFNIDLKADDYPAEVSCELDGFKKSSVTITSESDVELTITLEELPKPEPKKAPATTTKKQPKTTTTKTTSKTTTKDSSDSTSSSVNLFDTPKKPKGSKSTKSSKDSKDSKDTKENKELDNVLDGW